MFPIIVGYVGPGAGFAFFSTILVFVVSVFLLLLGLALVPVRWFRYVIQKVLPVRSLRLILYFLVMLMGVWYVGGWVAGLWVGEDHPRFVVLGMDGLDPDIVRTLMDRGELPNFKRLTRRGEMSRLRVPNPPISPTSWASFITGSNPGRHGILGFIGRNPRDYTPELFTRVRTAKTFLNLPVNFPLPGPYHVPLTPPEARSERQGKAFWDVASEHGISSTVIKVPVTFPPESVKGKMLSGLGTPDLRGTQGVYSFWTERDTGNRESTEVNFTDGRARSRIVGPRNTLLDRPRPVEVPVTFVRSDTMVRITIDQQRKLTLRPGRWTDWVQVDFPLGMGMSVSGIVRFHLGGLDPFQLYMTPIQIDPKDPVMAISHPESYSRKLAKRIGYFYTMGMAQDDQALKDENITDTTFLQQAYQGLRERRRILGIELRRERSGLMVAVFDTMDRIQHLFWRYRDPHHPLHPVDAGKRPEQAIQNIYRKMDAILGEVLDAVDKNVPILVVSDHGFTSFRRQFHVNDWLRKQGYLAVKDRTLSKRGRFFRTRRGNSFINWKETTAYQVGLTGIYLNVQGREKFGRVPPEQKWEVARKIRDQLERIVDPKSGRKVFKNVYLSKNIYEGLYWQDGPDLILGYNVGFRTSWKSARGQLHGKALITDNRNKWSGDHVVDNSLVPGTLITSFPVGPDDPRIEDVAATMYDYYGIPKPEFTDGTSLLSGSGTPNP